METSNDHILSLVRMKGVIRPRDLIPLHIATFVLTRMVKNGSLVRVARGLYAPPNRQVSENASLGEVAVKYPQGIICLLSALRYHELGTQSPYEVWLAIPNKAVLLPWNTHPSESSGFREQLLLKALKRTVSMVFPSGS